MSLHTRTRSTATTALDYLMTAAFPSQRAALTDLAAHQGLMWRCVCRTINTLDADACSACEKPRPYTKDVTPPRYEYGQLLEDVRARLAEWFDDEPKERRPAAIGFRVTTEYDDGPAWATWDTTAYFTDAQIGTPYAKDFERSGVADALIELGDFERPQTGDTLIVVVPPPFAPESPEEKELAREYAYGISDYAHAAAAALGGEDAGWGSNSGYIGAYGLLWGPDVPTLRVYVDDYEDLVLSIHEDSDPQAFTIELPDGAPSTPDQMRTAGEAIADIIRTNFRP
ncbi:hypothetical protein ACIQ9R_36130 [Streptomyces sp. NPDC094447]|uniref:hypothetical protein n=1 Tax=Streptomyces sp. NPDC094447 TaxID=3366062 RepID=UPI00381F65E9